MRGSEGRAAVEVLHYPDDHVLRSVGVPLSVVNTAVWMHGDQQRSECHVWAS